LTSQAGVIYYTRKLSPDGKLPDAVAIFMPGGGKMIFNILQLIGGLILSLGYIPQITQTLKTKSVKDLNFKTYLLIFVGILFMEAYAINLTVHGQGHMYLVTNSMASALSGTMCILILLFKGR
jgi:MtN3 and saliva related transmembrane protein